MILIIITQVNLPKNRLYILVEENTIILRTWSFVMSISFIHFGPSDLFMMVSFMYSLNVDVILQILLPIIWILPLITWASTLKRVSLWLYRSALQVFTFSHWSHSSSSGCQASNHSSNRFFLGMSMLLFQIVHHKGQLFPSFTPFQSSCEPPNVLLANVS